MNALMTPMTVLASPIVQIPTEALFVSVGLASSVMAGPLELDALVFITVILHVYSNLAMTPYVSCKN